MVPFLSSTQTKFKNHLRNYVVFFLLYPANEFVMVPTYMVMDYSSSIYTEST